MLEVPDQINAMLGRFSSVVSEDKIGKKGNPAQVAV